MAAWTPPSGAAWNNLDLITRGSQPSALTEEQGDLNKTNAESAMNWLGDRVMSYTYLNGLSIIGNTGSGAGNASIITAANNHYILRRSGTTLGFGSIDISQPDAVGSSVLRYQNGGLGLSTIGTAGQQLRVNGAANGYEFFTGTTIFSVENGLYQDGSVVKIGGPLIEETSISLNGFRLTIDQGSGMTTSFRDTGEIFVYANAATPSLAYSPTLYNSAAGVLISSLGSAVTPDGTIHVRGSGDSSTSNTAVFESSDGANQVFVGDNGQISAGVDPINFSGLKLHLQGSVLLNGADGPNTAAIMYSAADLARFGFRTASISGGTQGRWVLQTDFVNSGPTWPNVALEVDNATRGVTVNTLAGTGNRMVYGSSTGLLAAGPLTVSGNDLTALGNFGANSLAVGTPALVFSSTLGVLSNVSGTGFLKLSGYTISFDNATYVTSTATSGYVPYMSSGSTLANSPIQVSGTNTSIASPTGTAQRLLVKSSGSNVDEISLEHAGNSVKIASLGQSGSHGSLALRTNGGVLGTFLRTDGSSSYITIGNFSIGSTTATSLFNVGSSAQFQVTTAGAVSTSSTITATSTITGGADIRALYTSGFYLNNAGAERSRWYETGSNIIINRASPTGFKLQQANTDQFEITTGGNFIMSYTTSLRFLQYTNGTDVSLVGQGTGATLITYNATNTTSTGGAQFGLSNNSAALSVSMTAYNTAYAGSLGAKSLADIGVLAFVKEGIMSYTATLGLSIYTASGTLMSAWGNGTRYENLQVGNAGLSTGQLYQDTAANILANGDNVVGIKV